MNIPPGKTTGSFITSSTIVITLVAVAAYWLGTRATPEHTSPSSSKNADAPKAASNEVLYWYDPMVPQQHFDKPGKSPFMDMELVPRYAEPVHGDGSLGVRIDPRMVQNLGVRTASAAFGHAQPAILAIARLAFNERESAIVQARTDGFVEQVYQLAPGDVVAAGTPLVDILVPTWTGAQKEFLAILAAGENGLAAAARERLKLLGMPKSLVEAVENTAVVKPLFTVTAPFAGVLETLNVRPGMSVANGMTLARINSLTSVWLDSAVPESEIDEIETGAPIEVSMIAFPGETMTAEVVDILPSLDTQSRTATVRALLANPLGRLRPGQYAELRIRRRTQSAQLLVPSMAVIRGAGANRVIVAENGYFRPVAVTIGGEYEDQIAIVKGLEEGQKIVVSGQFLIDSEANLTGVLTNMDGASPSETPSAEVHDKTVSSGNGSDESADDNHLTRDNDDNTSTNRPTPSAGQMLEHGGEQP